MADYISREAAVKAVCKNCNGYCFCSQPCDDVICVLESVPAADVRPVVRGKWIAGREIGREYIGNCCVGIRYEDWKCSACGCTVEEAYKPKYNFCPNCGADMRERENAEEEA